MNFGWTVTSCCPILTWKREHIYETNQFVLHLQFLLFLRDSNQSDKDPQSLVDLILNQLLYLWREVAVEVIDEEDVALVQRQLAFPH